MAAGFPHCRGDTHRHVRGRRDRDALLVRFDGIVRGDPARAVVGKVKVGDYVVQPFNVACGFCRQCEQGLTHYSLTVGP